MKTLYSLLLVILSSTFAFGQIITMGGNSYTVNNPLNCTNFSDPGVVNFVDDGGATGDYSPGLYEILTICPDIPNGTPKIQASFGGQGFTWDVHSSDFLTVFDGPFITSPSLGSYNNANAPTGFGVVASWTNATGCLTFVFESDGANQGTGWEANISCASPPQDIEMHMEGFINNSTTNTLDPADTGYVDICQGDSVLFVAKPVFPFSSEITGQGYSQTLDNIDYLWEFSDGTVGPNNDSVWYKPNGENGIFVGLNITDSYPHNTSMSAKVRISTTPSFLTSGPLQDSVCFGVTTELTGGVTNSDTTGVNIPENSFQLGGNYAGLTYLPDGSNAEYTTEIHMSGFPPGSTVQNVGDIQQMCVDMEHSYLGDLEMWLECPDGTEVIIFNSYTAGNFPGGFGGGPRFLGEPIKSSNSGPGNGYEYCFSSVNNNWGPFATEYQNNTIPTPPTAPSNGNTMDPNGIYAPEDSFLGFQGCPLNGDWTLHVKDNWAGDDGYIFEWGIFFDPSLYPENEFYQNTITDAFWTPEPTMVSDPSNDTIVSVEPGGLGDYFYTFNVTDDFGCSYDTTLTLHVLDTIVNVTTSLETLLCKRDSVPVWAKATGTVKPFSFQWEDGQFADTALLDTAYYNAFENGQHNYIVTVTDACGISVVDTAVLIVNQTLAIDTLMQFPAECGMENGIVSGMGSGFIGTPKYKWTGPGSETPDNTTASVWADKPAGWYYFSITDDVCKVTDSILLEQAPPPVADFTPNPSIGAAPLDVTFINNSDPGTTYEWDFGNGTGNTVNNLSDQYATYVSEGVYTVSLEITEGACTDQTTRTVTVFFPMSYDMPNVFTPNGDGQNDLFTINPEYATELEIVIVNRWGNVVFESTDINFAWNGQVNNSGAECSDGTYFYQFKIKGSGDQQNEEHGFVQLVRDN